MFFIRSYKHAVDGLYRVAAEGTYSELLSLVWIDVCCSCCLTWLIIIISIIAFPDAKSVTRM